MTIRVFGLGYVGVVTAACFAKIGHTVIGVDISADKVDLINRDTTPIVEEDTPEIIAEAAAKGLLHATTNTTEAAQQAGVLFVCVGTPSNPNGSLDYQYVCKVTEQIGAALI